MKVADYTSQGRSPLNLRITYHGATDLLYALWILTDRRTGDAVADLDLGDAWFDDLEDALSEETRALLAPITSGDLWIGLTPLLPDAGEGGTIDGFIEYLRAMEAPDLRLQLMTLYDMVTELPRDVVADAAEGNAEAVEAVLAAAKLDNPHMKQWRETLRTVLLMEPGASQDLIIGIIEGFQRDAFVEHERAFRPLLQADAKSKRQMARRLSPERLLDIATSGINFSEDRAYLPTILMPTMVARPWVVFASGPDFFVLGYPVSDEFIGEDPDAPPPWLVKLHKALGDERRLRILRTLAEGDASLADLAEKVDIAKSTLHHHLMLLRAAGLVRVHVGDDKRYSLRNETFSDAATFLDHYIHPTTDPEGGS